MHTYILKICNIILYLKCKKMKKKIAELSIIFVYVFAIFCSPGGKRSRHGIQLPTARAAANVPGTDPTKPDTTGRADSRGTAESRTSGRAQPHTGSN